MPELDALVRVEGLVKEYRQGARAVDGLSFGVAAGEVYGLLGPNGAGKTTTVRIAVAMLAPTSGRVVVAGHDVVTEAEAVRQKVGYAAQGSGVDIDLTVRENLVLRARLHRLARAAARQRTDEMLARLNLEALAGQRAGLLSGGQRRRLDLALALVHQPLLVMLDEPTSGLDPQARRALWEEIDSLSDSGTTVVLTTQHMDEADRLCRRVGIIDEGRMVAEGTPAELKAQTGGEIVTITFEVPPSGGLEGVAQLVRGVPGVGEPVVTANAVTAPVEDPVRSTAALLTALEAASMEVAELQVGPPTLEDVYLHHTGVAARADAGVASPATGASVALGAHGAVR